MDKTDRSGAPQRAEDDKLGQAISQAMKQIKRQETEREHPKPGQIIRR